MGTCRNLNPFAKNLGAPLDEMDKALMTKALANVKSVNAMLLSLQLLKQLNLIPILPMVMQKMMDTVDLVPMPVLLPVQVDVVKTDLINSHGSIAILINVATVMLFKSARAKYFLLNYFANFTKC